MFDCTRMRIRPTQRSRNAGFTLVELLVVIAIISLLIAMLLPALEKAREATRKIQCLSNIRNVCRGALSYSNDSLGFGPPSTFNNPYKWHKPATSSFNDVVNGRTYPPVAGLDDWFGYSADTPAQSKFYYREKGCPNFVASWVGSGEGTAFAGNHYILGMARTNTPTIRDFWVRLDDQRVKGAYNFLFVESYHGQATDFQLTINGRPNGPYQWRPRHQAGLNLAFVDGHAAFHEYVNGVGFAGNVRTTVPGVTW